MSDTMYQQRKIWFNLILSLFSIPLVSLIVLASITIIGALDDFISKIQITGYWGVLLLVIFVLTFFYLNFEPKIRTDIERRKIVNALTLYLKDQLDQQKQSQPSKREIESIK